MGLRCSLLGHDYGDVVTEREREARGSEVVVTERELRTCSRCDAETVVSENTEVRRRRPEEGGPDEEATSGEETASDRDSSGRDRPSAGSLVEEAEESSDATDDAMIIDDAAKTDSPTASGDGNAADGVEATSGSSSGTATDDPSSPSANRSAGEEAPAPEEADDVEFIDADGPSQRSSEAGGSTPPETDASGEPTPVDSDSSPATTAENEPGPSTGEPESARDAEPTERSEEGGAESTAEASGSWPDRETGVEADPHPAADPDEGWPNDPSADDRGTPHSSSGDEERSGEGSRFEFEAGETDAASGSEAPSDPGSGIASAGPLDATGSSAGDIDGILHCPACDFAVRRATTSHRAGDICPECHAGYLAAKD